jgi:hypothetical protein
VMKPAAAPALTVLETAMTDLISAGGIAMKWIKTEAIKELPHVDRADLVRLEIAIADLLFALRPRT